jgi:phage terminase large subunit
MLKIDLPHKFEFLFKPKRFKIAYGGRGGAKTVSFSKALAIIAANSKTKVLCLREFQNSIDDSVHSSLKDEIELLGLTDRFKITNTQIEGYNGSSFKYAALARNLSSIKSKHKFNVAWIEEAETISQKSWDTLIPTMREPGSEIWASFNPDDEFGSIYQLVKPHLDTIERQGFYEDDEIYIAKVNLEDNPFAPQELIDASAKMKAVDFKKWRHIYGGEVFSDYRGSIIQPEWVEAAIDAHKKLGFKPEGVKSAGFDPADEGSDAKAFMLRHGSVITNGLKWSDGDFPEAIDRAFNLAYELRAEHIVYDADGMGVGVKVGLAKRIEGKNIIVTPYRGNDAKDNENEIYADDKTIKDTFKNKRAQYYWNLVDRFQKTYNAVEKKLYTDPSDLISLSSNIEDLDLLKSELTRIERKKGQNSYIQIESKEDMRARKVKSPNMADALAMCFANPAPRIKIPNLNFRTDF